MKIAVCISGAARSGVPNRNLRLNYERLNEVLPNVDFYFGCWKGYERQINTYFPDKNVFLFDEPKIDYHPFIDIPGNQSKKYQKTRNQAITNKTFQETSRHQTKQILAHAYLIDSIDLQYYDIIIRARYDTIVYHKAHFNPYILDCFESKRPIGFATLLKGNFMNPIEQINNDYTSQFLFDQLIIHRADMFDTTNVYTLSETKNLMPAEFGWWQVLSKPYENKHRCISGWANPDKSVEKQFI